MNLKNAILLAPIDVAFADMLQAKQPEHGDCWLLAALTSHAYRAGNACLTLDKQLEKISFQLPNGLIRTGLSNHWLEQQHHCSWWQSMNQSCPLVWSDNRLYLRRAWQDELIIMQQISLKLNETNIDSVCLTPWLDALFGAKIDQIDWQRVACALASRSLFTIITGGPGTGKTTTVVKLLALLQSIRQALQQPLLTIGLSAPTGKAAARLISSIQQASSSLADQFQVGLPTKAQTLHKWLSDESLAQCDCFIVDEASMIDLQLMAKLLRQLPLSTRLILLGDKDQLASVDAGAVMAQLCDGAELGVYSQKTQLWLNEYADISLPNERIADGNSLAQQTIMLRHSHRFNAQSDIGKWANWVNHQAIQSIKKAYSELAIWHEASSESLVSIPIKSDNHSTLKHIIINQLHEFIRLSKTLCEQADVEQWAKNCHQQLAEFQLLCSVREGYWGIDSMNQRIAQWMGLTPNKWQAGRVVMVTRNDYTLNLMNGEMGICLQHPTMGLRIAFNSESGVRWILPSRLSEYEDAFAISVHKSQGSEFNRVMLLLPNEDSPILTKELIYTAITRAKKQFIFACPVTQRLFDAVERFTQRSGGLNFD